MIQVGEHNFKYKKDLKKYVKDLFARYRQDLTKKPIFKVR